MTLDDLMYKPGLLRDQRILITGGGTGLGRVMAEAALLLGAEVHICGRRSEVVQQAAVELVDQHGGTVVAHTCDIRSPDAISAMLDGVWNGHGPLTGLVNNAAGNFISRTEDLSPSAFDVVGDIVFRGTFYVTLDCGKRWIAAGQKASVLSILTTWVWNGSAHTVPSAMAKSGIHAMTQSLAVEWGSRGIRFNAIAPGLFPTEGMSARLNPDVGGQRSDMLHGNPMQRPGNMPELANLAVYLLGPGSEYVNGQTIAIDGAQFQATGANFSGLRAWSDEQWAQVRASIKRRNMTDRMHQKNA